MEEQNEEIPQQPSTEVYATEEQLAQALQDYGAPVPEEKQNIHTFLTNVVKAKDTTKTGYLSDVELGVTPYSERTYKTIELYSENANDDLWALHFKRRAEILTATSLSRNAKLLSLAVLQRRELADTSDDDLNRKKNSGWFSKKEKEVKQI
jgi:hypothetical protein